MRRRFLRSLLLPLACSAACTLWACVAGAPSNTTGSGGAQGGAGGGGTAGGGGSAGGSTVDGGPSIACALDNGSDPVGFCTQKLLLRNELAAAFDAKTGVAQSWGSTSPVPDMGPGGVLHDPRDDAGFCAAVARYAHSAEIYGDGEVTIPLEAAMVSLQPALVAELTPPPAGYAGELYLDLRTAAGGLRILNDNGLAAALDAIAETYGRAIYSVYYTPLATTVDGGVTDAVLGTPASPDGGSAIAYAPGDVATGALALVDLASRHVSDDPVDAAAWQRAAAAVLAHIDARGRDPVTGLYYAALVTSADPDHDQLAPAVASSPPADALLTDVAARVALALLRAQALATASPSALPDVAAAPLEARAEALLRAFDAPQSLWDATLGGYYEGWVPSTAQLLTEKPTRANALLMAAIHDAFSMGNGPDPTRQDTLRTLLTLATSPVTPPNSNFMSVVANQTGDFLQVPDTFAFGAPSAGDGGVNPRTRSYFASANHFAVEGLSELWLGLPD